MSELQARQKQILEELSDFDDWKEKYSFILDLGDELPILSDEFKREEFLVKGCVSQVWLVAQKKEDSKIYYKTESDSVFVKGLAALMVNIYSGLSAQEILSSDANFLIESGLVQNLSPNRVNGVGALWEKIRFYAKALEGSSV